MRQIKRFAGNALFIVLVAPLGVLVYGLMVAGSKANDFMNWLIREAR